MEVLDSNCYAVVGFCIYILTYKLTLNHDAKNATKKMKEVKNQVRCASCLEDVKAKVRTL